MMQTEIFANRLRKRFSHLRKWAKRVGVSCYRLYDRDIPEVPLAVDRFEVRHDAASPPQVVLRLALYTRPYEKSDEEEAAWCAAMQGAAAEALGVTESAVIWGHRMRQRGASQYGMAHGDGLGKGIISEGGLFFQVDLASYLDGLFFPDHRILRGMVHEQSRGKRVLNLFSYTGAFSVYAAAGGAAEVTSVDLSRTYLEAARRNFALNGLDSQHHPFIQDDVSRFLARGNGAPWDVIILDPPTFSNSKRTTSDLDTPHQWPAFVSRCLELLAPRGTLYFSTNSRRLRVDPTRISGTVEDITARTTSPDYEKRPLHRCWTIRP
jgi:23S rRNA (cytosine1962-C5)-methyltransferase